MAAAELEPPRLQITRLCRSIRETAKLRQEDMGDLIADGRTKGQVSYYESGRVWPRDVDLYLDAYAQLAGTTRRELWRRALDLWDAETAGRPAVTSVDQAIARLLG